MLKVMIYIIGLVSGVLLSAFIRKCTKTAAESARESAIIECHERQRERTDAFNRGYARARADYRNMSEVERFADTLEGHRVKLRAREAN